MELTNKKSLNYNKVVYDNELGIDPKYKTSVRSIFRTSGTSGYPLFIAMNDKDLDVATEIGARCFTNAGVVPGMLVANCMNYRMWAGGGLDSLSLRRAGAALINFGVGGTEELIETIFKLKIEALSCTPSYASIIEKVLKEKYNLNPSDLGIKLFLFGGESGVQNPEFRKSIEEKWNAVVIDANYGSCDSISMFASENYLTKDGLKFLGYPYLIPKLVDLETKEEIPIKKGNIGILVVSTDYEGGLVNRKNYCLDDVVEILSDDKEFRFKIIGRADEMLVIKGLNVYPETIRQILIDARYEFDTEFVGQFRVSKSDPIDKTQLIILLNDVIKKSKDKIETYLIREFKDRCHISTTVNYITDVAEITGSTGKIKLINRCIN